MAGRYNAVGVGARILALLLLIIIMILGGLLWFDYLGLIDVKGVFAPVLQLVGIQPRSPGPGEDDPMLLDKERLSMQQEELKLRNEELDKRQQTVESKEQDITQKEQTITEQQKSLEDQQKLINDQQKQNENKKANVAKNAEYLVNMPPDNAVKILQGMDSQDVIDIFRATDEAAAKSGNDSIVPYWISLLPADKAAEIQRKMAKQPES